MDTTNTVNQSSNTAAISKIELPQDICFFYKCCGNCRFYSDGWCGYLRTTSSGSDSACSNWEE